MSSTAAASNEQPRYSDRERFEHADEFLAELTRGIPETERGMVVYAAESTPPSDERFHFWPRPWRQDQEKDRLLISI